MMTAQDRAAFRAWVRTHHPDVGGDPAEFADGLRRMRAAGADRAARAARAGSGRMARGASRGRPPVVVVRRRRGPLARLIRWRERRRRARRLL
jgi:hypothetical protein